MTESAVTAKLIRTLNSIPRCYARKQFGGRFSSGEPDVKMVYAGRPIFIEVKLLSGKLSSLQAIMLTRWQNAGAICAIAVFCPEKKSFTFFINSDAWNYHVGKLVTQITPDNVHSHTDIGYHMVQDLLKKICTAIPICI